MSISIDNKPEVNRYSCTSCYKDWTWTAGDLRVYENECWCKPCWDERRWKFPDLPSWNDLEQYMPALQDECENLRKNLETEQQPAVDQFIATFRCENNGIVGTTNAKIHSVTRHDDGIIEVVIDHWPEQPADHPAITHCDNCGCDWLDNGLNPIGCPYCKQPDTGLVDALERIASWPDGGNQYGQQNIKMFAEKTLAAYIKQHPDDDAVDRFAAAMKAKLAKKRSEGRTGWQSMTAEQLSAMLYEHVRKGDPVDVANLAMMLHQNGQKIEQQSAPDVQGDRLFCDLKTDEEKETKMNTHSIEPTQEELEDFIFRTGFHWGWRELESWARRMAEQAVREKKALQAEQDALNAENERLREDVAELVEALEDIQKAATRKSIHTGIHAAAKLGRISAICEVTLDAHYKKVRRKA